MTELRIKLVYRQDNQNKSFNTRSFTNDSSFDINQRWLIFLTFLYGEAIKSIQEQVFNEVTISSKDISMSTSDLTRLVPDELEERVETVDEKEVIIKIATLYIRNLDQVFSLFSLFKPQIDEKGTRYFTAPESSEIWEWIKQNLTLNRTQNA